MNRAQFLSMMAAVGATIICHLPYAAKVTPDGTICVGPGMWWIEIDRQGTISASLLRRDNLVTLGYVLVR